MPNLVVGTTDISDQELRRSLYSIHHDAYTFPVTYFPDMDIVKHLIMSKCRLDISCHPLEIIDKIVMESRGKSRGSQKVRRGDNLNIFDK